MYQVLFSSLERASSFVMYILKYLEIFVSLLRNNKTRDVKYISILRFVNVKTLKSTI